MKIREIAKGTFKVMFGVWLGMQAYDLTKATMKVLGKRLAKAGLNKLCDFAGVDRKEEIDELFGDVAAKEEEEES